MNFFSSKKKVKRREKFCVILESLLSVNSSEDISLRNRMKMKSYFRSLFLLRVNRKWLKDRLEGFSNQELMKMKIPIQTLFQAFLSFIDDRMMEIRKNVWIFLSIFLSHILRIDNNYPIKTLQFFLPLSILEFFQNLKSAIKNLSLDQDCEDVVFESLGAMISIFSSITTNFSGNSIIEIFLLEPNENRNQEQQISKPFETDHDFFPKLNKFVQLFQSSWVSLKKSNYLILQFLNILNSQNSTYEHTITPMYIRSDPYLRNLRYRYHLYFQTTLLQSKKRVRNIIQKANSPFYNMFFNTEEPPRVDYDKVIPYLVSFMNIFCVVPKYLFLVLTDGKNADNEEIIIEDVNGINIKLKRSLLGNFFSLSSVLTVLKTQPNRDIESDDLKSAIIESNLHLLFLITHQLTSIDQKKKREYGSHSLSLFRKKKIINGMLFQEEVMKDLDLTNLVTSICYHIIIFSSKSDEPDNFILTLKLLRYLFSYLSSRKKIIKERREELEGEEEEKQKKSKIITRRIKIEFLRLWEVLVGKLSRKVKIETKSLIISIFNICLLKGEKFLHIEDRISLIYELIRRDEDIGLVFHTNEYSEILGFIGSQGSLMVENGPHSLNSWKRKIQYEMIPKIEEWKKINLKKSGDNYKEKRK